MDRPAIDNLNDPGMAEIYYFDDTFRERVRAKQQDADATEATKPTKTVKKARKSR